MFNIELKLHLGPEVEHSYPGSDAFAPALTTRKWCIHTPLHSIFGGKSFAFVPPPEVVLSYPGGTIIESLRVNRILLKVLLVQPTHHVVCQRALLRISAFLLRRDGRQLLPIFRPWPALEPHQNMGVKRPSLLRHRYLFKSH